MRDWVPPGYISLTAFVRQHGVDNARNDLITRRYQAYKFDRTTGEMALFEPRLWGVEEGAQRWLEHGWLAPPAARHFKIGEPSEFPCMIVVRMEYEPVTDGVYLPPFVALVVAAVRNFGISEERWPTKKELVEYFCAQKVDGKLITANLASQMATLCRPPSAMRGGNPKG